MHRYIIRLKMVCMFSWAVLRNLAVPILAVLLIVMLAMLTYYSREPPPDCEALLRHAPLAGFLLVIALYLLVVCRGP